MTNKHSPGPWSSQCTMSSDLDAIRLIWSDTSGPVAKVRVGPTIEQDEALANARLIAAAPDLLAALKLIAQSLDESDLNPNPATIAQIRQDCRTTIAKAKGE